MRLPKYGGFPQIYVSTSAAGASSASRPVGPPRSSSIRLAACFASGGHTSSQSIRSALLAPLRLTPVLVLPHQLHIELVEDVGGSDVDRIVLDLRHRGDARQR